MGQTELGEVAEGSGLGRGGSSTMPHKRNPVSAAAILSSTVRIPGLVATMLSATSQEHERGLGGWHAEWETLPEIGGLTLGALERLSEMLAGLQVFPDAMTQNLALTNGLLFAEAVSMALAGTIGKAQAHLLVEEIVRKSIDAEVSLQSMAEADQRVTSHLNGDELKRLFLAENYLGDSQRMIDAVLSRYRGSTRALATGGH